MEQQNLNGMHGGSELLQVPTAALKEHPKNPRQHSRKQIKLIAENIKAHGFNSPIIIDEANTVLAGHGRLAAAKLLGLTHVPAVRLSHLSDQQKLAYLLADNKLAERSSWDSKLLKLDFQELLIADYEVELTGFETGEIDLRIGAGTTEELDQTLPLDHRPVAKLGDLWQLGEHRLYCGNSLEAASYTALLQGEVAQMVFTDPPYNVSISEHVKKSGDGREFPMASGEMDQEEFTAFLRNFLTETARVCQDGAIIFSCIDWRHMRELLNATPTELAFKQLCVWTKDRAGMGTFYRSQHELVFVFKKGQASHINNFGLGATGRSRSNVWAYPMVRDVGGDSEIEHPTPKPVGMIVDAIRDCSKRNGIILDPFTGSGTIFIAASATGRRAYGIELDPLYIDLAILNWQRQSGQQAVHVASGQTHAERSVALAAVENEVVNGR